jgi:23S rRNA (uracil1939-C5)-methyltransferase
VRPCSSVRGLRRRKPEGAKTVVEITIEKLIYGGEGLAHHDGSTVFVPFVLPAERITAAPVEQKKKFIRARLDRLLEASPDRASARCPHFGVCGGCDYQHIPYDSQLKYKTEILRETLRRIGRIEWPGEIALHPSPPWGYRNRAQWKVRPLGDDGALGMGVGYFQANSTALCAVEDCAILSPILLKTLLALRAAAAAGVLPRELREIEAFAGAEDSKLLVTGSFAGFPARAGELVERFRKILPEIESLLFYDPTRERMELDGPGYVECEAASSTFRVGHFSFFQVNRFLAGELARVVAEQEPEGRLALDLFAGVGLFSVPLAKRFARVIAVESNPAAARDLEANTAGRIARSGRVIEVRSADVESFLAKLKERPELVVLDPPRAGLTPGTIKHLARIAPARITYVSCDPPTLARDLGALVKSAYDISGVRLFDLFPQTFHMESVVSLCRRP